MTHIENRSDIINTLVKHFDYTRYLEIGVRDNKNFNRIQTPYKIGVDPAGKCKYKMTSDDFFRQLKPETKYDIVFIDGMHLEDYVLRDVENSLKHLSDNGSIVLHDCNPQKPEHATDKYKGYGTWNGTVYRAIVKLRMTREDLNICVVDADTGCGLIRRGSQKLYPKHHISFELLARDRVNVLNLITTEEFSNTYGEDRQ